MGGTGGLLQGLSSKGALLNKRSRTENAEGHKEMEGGPGAGEASKISLPLAS